MKEKHHKSEQDFRASDSVPSYANELGTRIKSIIRLIGTRKDAAKYSGVSDDMLYRYMRGQSKPSFEAMIGIARAAGVSVEWLATGEGEMKLGNPHAHCDMMKDVLLDDPEAAQRREEAVKQSGRLISAAKNEGYQNAIKSSAHNGVSESGGGYEVLVDPSLINDLFAKQARLLDKQMQLMDKQIQLMDQLQDERGRGKK